MTKNLWLSTTFILATNRSVKHFSHPALNRVHLDIVLNLAARFDSSRDYGVRSPVP